MFTLPSGIKPGTRPGELFWQVARSRFPAPPWAYPIVEEGSYDEIKACCFRALTGMALEVRLKEICDTLREGGFAVERCAYEFRRWSYSCPDLNSTYTEVDIRLTDLAFERDIHDFLERLSKEFQFRYHKLSIDKRLLSPERLLRGLMVYTPPCVRIDLTLIFPSWM